MLNINKGIKMKVGAQSAKVEQEVRHCRAEAAYTFMMRKVQNTLMPT